MSRKDGHINIITKSLLLWHINQQHLRWFSSKKELIYLQQTTTK